MWTNPGKQVERFTTQLDTSKKSAGMVPQLRKDEMQRIKISFGATNYNSLEINAKQLAVLASKLGQPIQPNELNRVFAEIDINNDGGIDFAEFYAWWTVSGKTTMLGATAKGQHDKEHKNQKALKKHMKDVESEGGAREKFRVLRTDFIKDQVKKELVAWRQAFDERMAGEEEARHSFRQTVLPAPHNHPVSVYVHFDGYTVGTHKACVQIQSNNSLDSMMKIPITLTVTPSEAPKLETSVVVVNRKTATGMSARAVVTLKNTGKEELELERMVVNDVGLGADDGGAPVGMYSGSTNRQFTSKEVGGLVLPPQGNRQGLRSPRKRSPNGSVSPTLPTGEVHKSGKSTFYRQAVVSDDYGDDT
jgi:Ca2+-binding EF-hand superfamily protein